jgi:hypothetical protein
MASGFTESSSWWMSSSTFRVLLVTFAGAIRAGIQLGTQLQPLFLL